MAIESSNKIIAQNTILLYFRMMFTMIVSLYTSRIILQILGVDDYGISQSVGGLVGLISFINSALATGSSRFLTFELGTGKNERLRDTFSTVLIAHIVLALLIIFVAETFGLWFVNNKLVIPCERIYAALVTYHLSVLTLFFSFIQIPYTATIISHEEMGIYAYMSIIEVVLKLAIVYLLTIGNVDRLILFSILLCVVQIGLSLTYILYCLNKFQECHFTPAFKKDIMKDVLSYSGWSLFSSTATALSNQGAVVLINMFFSPGVVAARAIANQVNAAVTAFVQNFRTAANPQIVKRYAAKDYGGSKRLLLISTKISFYIMLILCLPICLVTESLLKLWLGQVPEFAVPFVQLAICTSLFEVLDVSFYTALYAKGRIRENALISPTILFLGFPVSYVLFKMGCSPIALAWVYLATRIILGTVVKPILLIKIVDYKWSDIISVLFPCFYVFLFSVLLPLVLYIFKDMLFPNEIISFAVLSITGAASVAVCSWYLGLNSEMRTQVKSLVSNRFKR